MSYKSNLTNHNPDKYQTNASFTYSAKNSSPVLELLDAQSGEKIIDLGCGTGQLTIQIKSIVGEGGEVVGVDSNEGMLQSARSSSPSSITYLQADIQNFQSFQTSYPDYKGKFDKVFTSATLHWCKSSPGGVCDLVNWLLKDGGKFIFEFGGFGNGVGIRSALHQSLKSINIDPIPLDPWYFPTVGQYEKVLRSSSLTPQSVNLVPRPTPLPTDLRGWLETFARNSFLSSLTDEQANQVLDDVVEKCRVDNYWSDSNPGIGVQPTSKEAEGGEGWEIMYVRLRGWATKSQ
ncbi:hypothetical protein L486_05596 [Kwoniella mangroviensis CBS 10435]|uniref:Methyltransferase domain-containing protein n=1 Tax=Kwoniella mangroviensis CBS 10435 TaxID=1331196 RepID=A0A1B9IME9_9TREE|nr:uncharacterized protein I203_07244 [Kwoniella mangroviensis CBS 8507]OCF56742.1 hypothetical protein L486_05596 [Kwoniella mangroviensis CBS 10435]OCF63548.1 hypothetical protein I203_07244 [Kwoniella mangroviensis CBS 8507]